MCGRSCAHRVGLDGGSGHFSGTIRLWTAEAAANASLLTFHQSNTSETNPGRPSAFIGVLNSCTQKIRRTFCTQSGDFGLLSCVVRSQVVDLPLWRTRERRRPARRSRGNFPGTRVGFTQRTHNAVARTRVQWHAWIQIPTKHLR